MNIRELAQHLNISIGTVSRALNGRRYVDPETRKRVLAAAAEFGYSPNLAGRSLRQGTSGMVAMMLPVSSGVEVASTIFMIVLEGLRRYFTAQKIDLLVLLCDSDLVKDFAYLRRVVERGLVDGMIIADIEQFDPRITYLLEKRLPFVAYGRSETPGDYSWVDFDLGGGAERGVQRLLDLGHRRIALVVPAKALNYTFVIERAYRTGLERNGIAVEPELILHFDASDQDGRDAADAVLALPERPTAMLFANEKTVIGFYHRLAEVGMVPGRDLSLIAVIPEPAGRFLIPRPTCAQSDLQGLGERIGEALLREMRMPNEPRVKELWPMQVLPGETDLPPQN